MKSTTGVVFFCTLLAAQAYSPYAFGQVPNAVSNANSVSVQILQTIDSGKAAAGTRFSGKVVNAVTTPQGITIQAGAAAIVTLVQTSSVAGMNTWALSLISPVSGGSASAAAAVGNAVGKVGQQVNGLNLPSGLGSLARRKNAAQNQTPAATNAVETQGTRVYVPANTQVRFVLEQTSGNTAAPAPALVSQAPAQTQPSAFSNNPNSRQPAPPAPASPGVTAPNGAAGSGTSTSTQAGTSTVVWANVQYVLQGCQRQAPHIVCQVQLTNLAGADANLATNRNSYYIDQAGNNIRLSSASAANCNLFSGCLALSGLPLAANFVFIDEDSKSTQLVRLQIQSRTGPVQFTNVQVK